MSAHNQTSQNPCFNIAVSSTNGFEASNSATKVYEYHSYHQPYEERF